MPSLKRYKIPRLLTQNNFIKNIKFLWWRLKFIRDTRNNLFKYQKRRFYRLLHKRLDSMPDKFKPDLKLLLDKTSP